MLLHGWSPLSLCLVWFTQGMRLQNCDPQAQRGAGAREEHWRTSSEPQYCCVLLTDLRGKAKRLWSLLCCESDKDKWHHCFCYLEAAADWGEDKGQNSLAGLAVVVESLGLGGGEGKRKWRM